MSQWLSSSRQKEEWTDEEVIARVLAGDSELYAILVRRHTSRLFRAVWTILANSADVEDVVQDAFVSAYKNLGQFEGRAKFSTWLTRIAVHRALEVMQGRREQSLDAGEQDYSAILRCHGRSPEQQTTVHEANNLLRQAIEQLPKIYRDVVVMRCLEETDTAETASHLRISESNVKVRLHRACAMMRRHLEGVLGREASTGGVAAA